MIQKTIDNGNEFVIDSKKALTEPDTIYFKDNGDYITISIEKSSGDEANYIVYKKAAKELYGWLDKHINNSNRITSLDKK